MSQYDADVLQIVRAVKDASMAGVTATGYLNPIAITLARDPFPKLVGPADAIQALISALQGYVALSPLEGGSLTAR